MPAASVAKSVRRSFPLYTKTHKIRITPMFLVPKLRPWPQEDSASVGPWGRRFSCTEKARVTAVHDFKSAADTVLGNEGPSSHHNGRACSS